MEAESYADPATAAFIEQHFLPVTAHIKVHPAWFKRFGAVWTPTILLLDHDGNERVRNEGYLTRADFNAWLRAGLGRLNFIRKQFAESERWYAEVASNGSRFAPEATYWRSVSKYSATHDSSFLAQVEAELRQKFPASLWTEKAAPWRH